MGAVVLFSGGLDSTVLAGDLLRSPFRYGLNPEEYPPVHLLTVAFSSEEAKKKEENLSSLVSWIQSVDPQREVQHHVVVLPSPMESYEPELRVLLGSTRISGPFPHLTGITADQRKGLCSPYTPGLHLFLVSVAQNLLSVPSLPFHGYSVILAGFQYEPETWDWHDRGKLSFSDTSPEWVSSVNDVLRATSTQNRIRMSAPFLDSRMTKFDIWELALQLGVPVEETSSCENGWMAMCGHCGPCVLRARTSAAMAARAKILAEEDNQ